MRNSALPESKLYELVELVYAAAQAPAEWQTFVNRFAEAIPGLSVALMIRSSTAEGGLHAVHAMIAPGSIPEFLRQHSDSSPWIRILHNVEAGVPFATEDHVPVATIKHTPFYKTFMKPYGIGGGFGIKLWDSASGRAVFVAMADEDQLQQMRTKVMPVLERLSPHLLRSLSLCWLIRSVRARGLEEGLSRQADAVFVLNERCEVVYMNAAASKALDDGIIRLDRTTQRLKLASRKESATFESLCQDLPAGYRPPTKHVPGQADIAPATRPRRLMRLSPSAGRGPNVLEIIPLARQDDDPLAKIFLDRLKEPHHLVTVRRRGGLQSPPVEDIRTILGLSQKEAEVTLAIVEGQSVEEYANSRDVTVDTVRWHLKNIYRRTECAGQADLVRVVLSLVGRANLA